MQTAQTAQATSISHAVLSPVRRRLLLAAGSLLLGGCGRKGPLFIPEPPAAEKSKRTGSAEPPAPGAKPAG